MQEPKPDDAAAKLLAIHISASTFQSAAIVHSPGGTIAARPVLLEAREDATAQWGEGLDAVLARFVEDI